MGAGFGPSFCESKQSDDASISFVYKDLSTTRKSIIAIIVTILTFFMVYDRLAIDGVLLSLQEYFVINDSTTALIQTFQAISSTIFFVLMGMVGDRIERKSLLLISTAIWFILVILSLLVGRGMFWAYLILRSFSGIGYAVVTSLGPVIVSDIFVGRSRGYCLMALSIAPLIGGTLSMSISSWFLTSGYTWHSAMIVSPIIILPLTLILVCLMPKHETTLNLSRSLISVGYLEEMKTLLSIKTYALLVFASTLSNLYQRAMSFWMPTILLYGFMSKTPDFYFGLPFPVILLVTLLVGLVALLTGMPLIMWVAESWQNGKGMCTGHPFSRSIPLIVTISHIFSSLITALGLSMFIRSYPIYLLCIFLNSFFTGGSAPLTTQILLDVTPRWNRASAMAINNLFVGLADSPSSLIVGALSDVFRGENTDPETRFNAFLYALYILLGCNFFSAALYGTATVFFPSDLSSVQDDDELSIDSDEETPILRGARNRRASLVERGLLSRKATLDTTLM